MIYVIFGPTASGKTDTAIKIANKLQAPIINADAFQVYQEMNIGTAKISQDDPNYRKHYLLDIVSPKDAFNVKEYQTLFRETLNKLLNEHADIVVTGGTGLYIKAALFDFDFLNEEEVSYSDLDKMSNDELYDLLLLLDKEAAKTIHPHNRKRVIRAITIARSGTNKSEIIANQKHELIYPNVKFLFINPNRDALYESINKRVDRMFIDNALVEETKYLLNKYELSLTAKQAIGYKETIAYLNGEYSLEECIELIKKRTRNYAKRQVTYFKNQFQSQVFDSPFDLLKEFKIDE